MLKLVERFRKKPNTDNRLRLERYIASHPMCVCIHPEITNWLRSNGVKV